VREFLKGVRHFAPSCVLEDLRSQCCKSHMHVSEAFAGAKVERTQMLTMDEFSNMLADLDLISGVKVQGCLT